MLLFVLPALAHGTVYATAGLVAAPDDPSELWALAGGWGLIHSTDGAATWEWWCEEALGVETLYGVETLGPNDIALASSEGLTRWTDGVVTPYTGLPPDAQVRAVRRFGARLLLDTASTESADGLYVCDGGTCVATSLTADGTYVQSIVVDTVAWVVMRESATLRATLWRSDDGDTWTQVADWGEGGPTRTMLHADGDTLWFWAQPRDPEALPWLDRSRDGGVSVETAWASPYGTTETPGLAAVDGAILLANNLGYTLLSEDDGERWSDVSETMPLIRCAADVGGQTWICADHFVDGFDIARLDGPDAWTAFGCMDDVAVPDPACAPYLDAYQEAGLYGGEACDASYAPASAPEDACGCGADEPGAAGLLALGWLARRARRPIDRTAPRGPTVAP